MLERALLALDFMRVAAARYGDAGQPLWPVALSSMYGAFLAGEAMDVRILVITLDASVDCWGAVVSSSPEERMHKDRRRVSLCHSVARQGIR
jgi:hypothetical protein